MAYIPHTPEEIRQMLASIGAPDVEALFASIPKEMRSRGPLNISAGLAENELLSSMVELSAKNRTISSAKASFLGGGVYRHYIPAAVTELASRSEFVTPYTPYQPEISQGTLQVLFEYQTLITRLFAMDVSNASHYSCASALADAVLMSRRIGKGRKKIVVPANVHPEYREVMRTVLCGDEDIIPLDTAFGTVDIAKLGKVINADTAAVVVQYPNFFGVVEDLSQVAKLAHDNGALLIAVVPEPIALGILEPPGAWGADIAVGEGLGLGLPTSFGGPTLGIFTVKDELKRQMPGRVCGKTIDADGRVGYVLTLSTREQHIRREKATSNICSNQALCATTLAIYLSLLGKEGLRELATINASNAMYLKKGLSAIKGVASLYNSPTFNEFVIRLPKPGEEVLADLAKGGVYGGIALGRWNSTMKNDLLVCATESNTKEEMDLYIELLNSIL